MTVIPAVMPADPAPASAETSSQPPARPGFDHALAKANDKATPRPHTKHDTKPNAKPAVKPNEKDGDATKGKADVADDTAAPKDVAALGDATVATLVAALTGNATQAVDANNTCATGDQNASDAAATQPGITNVFAVAVAALTDAETAAAAPTQTEPAWQKDTTAASATQVGEKAAATEAADFAQTVPGANAGADKGRAIDVLPSLQGTDGSANGAPHGHAGTTPAASNAAAAAVEHASEQSPVHGVTPASLTRNDESHAAAATAAPITGAEPVSTAAHVDAPVATTETASTAPAPPPPPAEQLLAVMRPLQRTADGTYRIRIELRPPELGRVDMRVEVKDGVVHASIHAEHAETAELVRNALDDLRARLDADGVRAGSLEVNDGRANDTRREQRGQRDSRDEPELIGAPPIMTTRPLYQSDALLDVRI